MDFPMIKIFWHCPTCKHQLDSKEIIIELNGTWIMIFTGIGIIIGIVMMKL